MCNRECKTRHGIFHIQAATKYSKKLSGGARKHLDGLIAQQIGKLLDSVLLSQ